MNQALDFWPLMLSLLTFVGGLDPTRPSEENATSFINHFSPEGTQSTWDGDIPAINQGLIPEESPESSFLVEGDIIKTSPFQMFSTASFKWPKMDEIVEIPYLFSSKYDQPSREVVLEAFADFEHFTCVRFVPWTNQKDFVSIIPMSGCFSSVGHSGGMQVVSLAPFCLQKGKGIVLHELMHVLGFWHEHSRADRDRYIHISWKEIRPGFEINFIKSQNSNMLVPYDYTSVMHYGRYAFSKNGNTTIMPLAGQDIPIGQRWNLSTSDIIRVNRLYECNHTVKDPDDILWITSIPREFQNLLNKFQSSKNLEGKRIHSEKKGSHQKLRVTDLVSQEEKKLHPTKTPLLAVSQPKTEERGSPGWSHSTYSPHSWEKEMAKTTWPTWLIAASSPGTVPELIFPSEAVPWESMKNTPISLNNAETTLLSEPVASSFVPFLKVLSRETMTSFPESKLLPETHNSILVEMGERGRLPSTLIPGRGALPKGTVTQLSGNGSFSLELQNHSPDWRARPEGTIAEIQTSHPRLGSIPGQLHRCQLCRQKEMAPTVGGVPREGRGYLWRLLKALAMASRNLPNIRGVRAQGPETREQLFAAKLKGDGALPKTLGTVFPAQGTYNPEAPEKLAQTLMEGRREADSWLAFGDATSVPDIPARHVPPPSTGQGRIWPSWGSWHRYQLRRDNSSGGPMEMHFSGVMSPSNSLGWVLSTSPSLREIIPALRRNNRDFTVPWPVSRNPATLSPGVASSGKREEFASAPYNRLPVEKAPSISLEEGLHSLKIFETQSELGLLNTLPTTNTQTPSSHLAPALFLKSQTNKILAQRKSPLLAAFTPHLSHLMENVTSDHFIFPVSPRKTQYLGTDILDEFFKRFGGAHSKVRTTTVEGKEVRQAGSPSLVGSAFPEGEMASPAVSVNPILSLEDSGNQKPHPSERIIQGDLGVTGKDWISSFAPLRRCPSGGIQLFVGGSVIPLLPVEPERIPRGYQSKGILDLLNPGVGKNVASFLSWIYNSKNVTLEHPMPPLQSPEDPQSQTFLLAETKPELLKQQRASDSQYAASGIVLLNSPSGLLSLVPLWECQGLSRVRELAYFPEPEAMEKEYPYAFGKNPSLAIEAMVQSSQDPKTQTLLLDKSQEDKGRDQLSIKITTTRSVRDEVPQTLEEKYGASNELPQHLTFTRIAKLATTASIIRQTTTQGKLQNHPQNLPPQKSGFWQGLGKATIGNTESRPPQIPQGKGCVQNQKGPVSSENINTQGPGLGSLPHPGWSDPVFLVKLGTQRQISELEATSEHSWLCLEGDCWEVSLQPLDSLQDLETSGVKSLRGRFFSSRSKSRQRKAAGTAPTKDVQITKVALESLQLSPQTESFHPDWATQSLISGTHFMDNLSLRPALPGNRIDPWSFDWFCDFEADLCGWQQNRTGAAWVLNQDQNSSSWRGSPSLESACHFPGGNHLSLQNQDSPQTIPKAVLISPILHGARWIQFWYGPLQPGMGTISVYVCSPAQFEWHLIWSSVGHWSSSWTWVEMKLWASRKIQVMVKGVQGPEDGAHLSIDNLSISSHQWSKGKTKLPCHSFKEALNKT